MLAAGNPRVEARYALDLYFKERGDPKFRGVDDLYATKAFAGENDWLRSALGAQTERLDTPEAISHTLRIANLQRILFKVMADNNLDALRLCLHDHSGTAGVSAASPTYNASSNRASSRRVRRCPILISFPASQASKADLDTFRSAGGSGR
jgi:hypothetical protein